MKRFVWLAAASVWLAGILIPALSESARITVVTRSIERLERLLPTEATRLDRSILTAYYAVRSTRFPGPPDPLRGGALAHLDGKILVMTREGAFHRLDPETGRVIDIGVRTARPPLDGHPLLADLPAARESIGYRDLALRDEGETVELVASEARLFPEESCLAIVIAARQIARSALTDDAPAAEPGDDLPAGAWRDVWHSRPCIDTRTGLDAINAGGAIALLPGNEIAVFVGDFGHDGVTLPRNPMLPQLDGNDYGKVLAVDLATGAARELSRGSRNPGGIVLDPDGNLWIAEHGPMGGDELNLVREGRNFGWPLETYGRSYGELTWPANPTLGRHEHFTRPVYSFVPSIAVSALAVARGDEFPAWEGDLLLASLRAGVLVRLRIREERVIVAEHLELGMRMRDIAVDDRGRIFLKHDLDGSIHMLTNITPKRDRSVPPIVRNACGGCHQLSPREMENPAAPTLVRVIGRRVASEHGFEGYSEALRAFGGHWTRERLAEFLRSPQSIAPGTAMLAADVSNDEIDAIIGFLAGSAAE